MSSYFGEGNSIFFKLGSSLHDIWIYRNQLFWVSFFSAFLLYVLNLVNPISSLDLLVSSYVVAAFSVLVYRFFRDKQTTGSLFSGYFDTFRSLFVWAWHMTAFIFLIMAFALISMSLDFLTDNLATGIVSIIAALLCFYISLRLIFVSLCLATGHGVGSFQKSWQVTKGRGFSLLSMIVPIFIIFFSISMLNDVVAYIFEFVNHLLPKVFQHVMYILELAFNVISSIVGWIWLLFFLSKVWIGWLSKPSH